VVDHKSFTRAAELMGFTPSAVSKQISQLEDLSRIQRRFVSEVSFVGRDIGKAQSRVSNAFFNSFYWNRYSRIEVDTIWLQSAVSDGGLEHICVSFIKLVSIERLNHEAGSHIHSGCVPGTNSKPETNCAPIFH
jgi:hypothetical protein